MSSGRSSGSLIVFDAASSNLGCAEDWPVVFVLNAARKNAEAFVSRVMWAENGTGDCSQLGEDGPPTSRVTVQDV